MSAERHSYVLDERQARVIKRAQAEAEAIQHEAARLRAEAERLSVAAGELLNDAVGIVLQAHGGDLTKVGAIDLDEEGRLVCTPVAGPPIRAGAAPAFVAKAAPEEKSPGPAFVAKPSGDS